MPPDSPPDTAANPRPDPLLSAPPSPEPGAKALGSGLFDDDLFAEEDNARNRAGLRWLVVAGLVGLLGVGGWLGYRTQQRRSVDPVVVTTGTPSRDTLENRVSVAGVMSLGNQQTLKAPGDVTVEAVLVEEGQPVAQGTVLLRLRDRNLDQQLDSALIQTEILALARQRNAELVQDQRRAVTRAAARLEDSRALLDQGFISEDEFASDRDALETAQSALRGAEVDLRQSDLAIRQNQAEIANLRARLADNAIVAPFDAMVLNIDVQPGTGVPREGALLTIGDPAQEVVLLDLMTLDANKISVNMPARVSVVEGRGDTYTGRIVSIAPQALSPSNSSGGGGQATVRAIAQLDRPSGVLIPGGAVNVDVILVQRDNALNLPAGTVQQEQGEAFVWVIDGDGRAQKRPVTTGLDTLEAVEILTGLSETDTVILTLPPDRPLEDGTPVETAAPGPGMPPAP